MAITNAVYGEVYNYYHNLYAPKTNSRYDAHNKSDLKKVYHSIVNNNKEKPVYLLDPFEGIQNYTISLKESAIQFGRDIASMGGSDADGLFVHKSVYSSDNSIAEVESLPGKKISDSEDDMTISVQKLAHPQINRGFFLEDDELGLEPGTYSFDVNTSVSNYELQFGISDNDTNYSIESRLSRLINNAAIGLTAKIIEGKDGTHALSISSVSAGAADGEAPFSINDEYTSQMKGVIDYLGIRNSVQKAGWAKYKINGEEFESPDNTVIADNKYSISLKGVSGDREVVIGTRPDIESLKENVIGIAGAYNQFIRSASEFLESQPRSNVLIDGMKRMGRYYQSTLQKFGMDTTASGELSVDEEELDRMLRNNATDSDVEHLKDFTQTACRKIAHVQLDPMEYVDKRIVAYKNPRVSHFPNPYITSAYSGMIFNSYM